jgi:tetratricopeptide (TPR) repeat protein
VIELSPKSESYDNPKLAESYYNLGTVLRRKGSLDEAIACFHKAVAVDPNSASAYNNMGLTLAQKGSVEEAIACFRKAIECDPKLAEAHHNLGLGLQVKGQLDEAIACFRKAVEFNQEFAQAHLNLGTLLLSKGQLDEAIACFRKALELNPKLDEAHLYLGVGLQNKGQLDEAITCFRKALELNPKLDLAHSYLARSRRQAAARDRLPAFQSGDYTPATYDERLGLAEWCQFKKLHRTAAGLCAAAFAADPGRADDLNTGHRYNAACSAALAAAGQGEDAAKLDDKERARLRKQALDWLRADLALRTKQIDSGPPAARSAAQQSLRLWQQDSDLISLRDKDALARLPAEEHSAFTRLWDDVTALLKKADEKAK